MRRLLTAWLLLFGSVIHAATFKVTQKFDAGAGTLRQAILDANASSGLDTITFDLPGDGVRIISISNLLPDITDPVILDGTTQPGFNGAPIVEVAKSANRVVYLLKITAGGSTVRGLILSDVSSTAPSDGVILTGGGGNKIVGCWLGVASSGIAKGRIRGACVHVIDSPSNAIGGITVSDRNTISGSSSFGVEIEGAASTQNIIAGNYIGTDPTGLINLGSFFSGILITNAPNNTVGGAAEGMANLIAANGDQTTIAGLNSTGNRILGNVFGIKADGSLFSTNFAVDGIRIKDAPLNIVGGETAAARNILGGLNVAIRVSGLQSVSNQVVRNYIGLDSTGARAISNSVGVAIIGGASATAVGGRSAGAGNVIAANTLIGVEITDSSSNVIQGNLIGTDPTGLKAVGNTRAGTVGSGVSIGGISSNTVGNIIGGAAPGARNVISGNNDAGVTLVGNFAHSNVVQGNFIGVAADGKTHLGNTGRGIEVLGANETLIGGPNPDDGNLIVANGGLNKVESVQLAAVFGSFGIVGTNNQVIGNVIAFSGGAGITLLGPNQISRNIYGRNGGLSIDHNSDGPTPNTVSGSGNYPVFAKAEFGSIRVSGSLTNVPNCDYTIEVTVKRPLSDIDPYGILFDPKETVQVPVGEFLVHTDANGIADFEKELPYDRLGDSEVSVSGTAFSATCDSETSEFSPDQPVINSGSNQKVADLKVTLDYQRDSAFVAMNPFRATATLVNKGANPVHNVEFIIANFGGLRHVTFGLPVPNIGTYDEQSGRLVIPVLEPGQSVTISLRGDLTAGEATVTAWATGTEKDDYDADNVASETFIVKPIAVQAAVVDQKVQISWVNDQTVRLERSARLGDAQNWEPDTTPAQVSNGMKTVTIDPVVAPAAFYRLNQIPPGQPSIELFQESLSLDSGVIAFSDRGSVKLTVPPTSSTMYFNLAVGDSWVIQNVPVAPAVAGPTNTPQYTFDFPLDHQTNIAPLWRTNTAFTWTTNTLNLPPSVYSTNRVYVNPVQIYSGMTNYGTTYFPAYPLTGGVYTVSVYRRCRHDFPNREQGKNECAPAAVLNSLEYLNDTFNLGIGPDALTLPKVKEALGWTTNGVSAADWVAKKKAFAEKSPYGIDTTETEDPDEAMNALNACCDVELWISGHLAAVQSITKLADGRYTMVLSDDVKQGAPGGTGNRTVTYDPPHGTIKGLVNGSPWSREFVEFIIECPKSK